jgi:hypothetical protein
MFYEETLFRPTLMCFCGGVGCAAGYTLSAFVQEAMDCLPPTFRRLAVDYITDPPRLPSAELSRHFKPEIWEAVEFKPSELALIGSAQGLSMDLVRSIERGEPRVAWLREIVAPELLRFYGGVREAAQTPAMARLAMAMSAAFGAADREPSWLAKLERTLDSLSPRGEAVKSLVRTGVPYDRIIPNPLLVPIVVGSSGGTGNGSWKPIAIAVQDLARRAGLQAEVRLHVITGRYRGPDSQDSRKKALSVSLDLEVEEALLDNTKEWSFPVGPGRRLTHTGPILFRAFRHEANDLLQHEYAAVLADIGRTLFYEYFSTHAFQAEKIWANTAIAPRFAAQQEAL